MKSNRPLMDEPEGLATPHNLPPIIDAHVHIFPPGIFSAVWKWFDQHGWNIRYRFSAADIFDFLLSRGVRHIVALQYAHKPGISAALNQYMAKECGAWPNRVTGMATIFPGEANAGAILEDAFAQGLKGVKLHPHVQCFDLDSDEMGLVCDLCQSHDKPMVIHAGREPKSEAYNCDPHKTCGAEKLESVLKQFPRLRVCAPHLGFDEITAFRKLTEKYENLWLDTAMLLADFFPIKEAIDLDGFRMDRIMYGSDFPNIPYAWDRELKWFSSSRLSFEKMELILAKNAVDFFGLETLLLPSKTD